MAKPSGQRSVSIEALKQRMARDPFSRAFLQLAEEYRKLGQFEEAARVCQEGLERHPGYHTARISLGKTYLESGDLEGSRATLAEVLELAPENHLAGKLLAEVQRRLGDPDGAAATYRAILRHYPGDREVETLLNDLQQGGGPPAPATTLPPAAGTQPSAKNQTATVQPVTGQPPQIVRPASPAPADPPAPPESFHPASEEDAPFVGVNIPQPAELPEPELSAVAPAPPEQPLHVPEAAAATGEAAPATDAGSSAGSPVPIPATPGTASPIPSPSIDPPPSLSALPLASGVIPRTPQSGWGGGRDDEEPDALQTNTLAELYLRQGLVDRAVEVYRSMLGVDPGNVRARRRLGELTEGIGGEMDFAGGRMEESTAVPDPPTQSDITVPPALALALQPGRLDAAAGPQRRRETINRLEKWLGIIRRPEPGPTGGSGR